MSYSVSSPHTRAAPHRSPAPRLPRGTQRPGRFPSRVPTGLPLPSVPRPRCPVPSCWADPLCLFLGSKAPSPHVRLPWPGQPPPPPSLLLWGPRIPGPALGTLPVCLRVSALSLEGPQMQFLTLASRSLRYSTQPCQRRGPQGHSPCPRRAVQRKPPGRSDQRGHRAALMWCGRAKASPQPPPSPPAPLGTDLEQKQVTEGLKSESQSGWGGRKGGPRGGRTVQEVGARCSSQAAGGGLWLSRERRGHGGQGLGQEGQCGGHGHSGWGGSSVQFSLSVMSLCDPMNHSTPGLPVHHQLPEFTQTHVH